MERLFLECAIRAALLVAGTAMVLYAMAVESATAKHRAWTGVVLLMLVLPMWTAWGPKAPVRVLPPLIERTANQAIAPTDFRVASLPPDTDHLEFLQPVTRRLGGNWQEVMLGVYLLVFFSLLVRLAIGTAKAHRLVSNAV